MRVIFLGNASWSVPTLEALAGADDIDVALAVTNPPRPAGRGSRLTPTAVAEASRRLELDVLEVEGVRAGEGSRMIEVVAPDAIVVVAYGHLLTDRVLEVPRLGAINLHFSLLPRWRGAAPVERAILEGDEVTGVSVMLLDEGMDTGPVLARGEEPIGSHDDAGSLGRRLASVGAPLVIGSLRALAAGTASPVAQDHADATYAPKLSSEERTIDWAHGADSIVRRVRAFAPEPGATTTFRGGTLKVLRTEIRDDRYPPGARPTFGEVQVDPDGVPTVFATGGTVALLEVVPAGRPHMSGVAWARGARLERGERCV